MLQTDSEVRMTLHVIWNYAHSDMSQASDMYVRELELDLAQLANNMTFENKWIRVDKSWYLTQKRFHVPAGHFGDDISATTKHIIASK